MKHYYLLPIALLFSFIGFAQRPKAVTDINKKGSSFPIGVQIINTGEELLFSAYDPKQGNQLFIYDGKELERVSRFSDSYKNGRFEAEEQSKIPLGAITSSYIPYKSAVIFTAYGELTKPSVYKYENGGLDKLKSSLTTTNINCVVNDDIYFVGNKYEVDKETGAKTWTKGLYKIEDGDHIKRLKFADKIAPRIKSIANVNGEVYFNSTKNVYLLKNDDYNQVKSFEKEDLMQIISVNDVPYVWAIRYKKKSLINIKTGRTLTNKLVKNRDRMGICPPTIVKGNQYVFFEEAYNRYSDVVVAKPESFEKGEIPFGIFKNKVKVDEIESFTWFKDQLLICMKEKGKKEFNLWQYNGDTIIKFRFKRISDIRSVNYLNGKLYFTAHNRSTGRELYEYIPYKAPVLVNQSFSTMETVSKGETIGRVKVERANGKMVKFKIKSGNTNDAFTIDEFTGKIKVQNTRAVSYRKNPKFNLKVEVDNQHLTSICDVAINIQESKSLNRNNLVERFLFFPDFTRKGVLKTNVLKEGETIEVYTSKLRMIDKMIVQNGEIQLGSYPPGIYYLNANNGRRNFVQKMEMN